MNDRAAVQRKARMKLLEEHKIEIETNKRAKIMMKLESDRADSPQNNNFLDLIATNLRRNNELHANKRSQRERLERSFVQSLKNISVSSDKKIDLRRNPLLSTKQKDKLAEEEAFE